MHRRPHCRPCDVQRCHQCDRSTVSERTPAGARALSVLLAPEAANAIVYTIAFEAVTEAEQLYSLPVSSQPPHLLAIAVPCARISRLTAINDQLGWRARRSAADEPIVITATDEVLRELAALLEETAQVRRRFPDAQLEHFAFDQAATAIRATLHAAPQ